MRPTKKAVLAALAELGTTPKAIAASLGRRRCKGKCAHPCKCPVAVYLDRRFPSADIRVGFDDVFAGSGHVARLPRRIQEFVQAFDDERFPRLVLE